MHPGRSLMSGASFSRTPKITFGGPSRAHNWQGRDLHDDAQALLGSFGRTGMRGWVFKVHLWIGALAGAFFVVLGITGSILAFELPLDHILNAKLSYISPATGNLPLSQIIRSVKANFPSDDVVAVTFAESPKLAWQVALPSGIACVNPHTGQVLGLRHRGQTVLGFARGLHVSLASGNIGHSMIRWSNLAALLLLTSGLGLWWRDHLPSVYLR
jgi:uncharacterized iron-regulated membrane protein